MAPTPRVEQTSYQRNLRSRLTCLYLSIAGCGREIMHREQFIRIAPGLLMLEAGGFDQLAECGNGVLVRVFSVNGLALGKIDPGACDADGLCMPAAQMHFDAAV